MSVKLLRQFYSTIAPQWVNTYAADLDVDQRLLVNGNFYAEGGMYMDLPVFTQATSLSTTVDIGTATEGFIDTVAQTVPQNQLVSFTVTASSMLANGVAYANINTFNGVIGDAFNGNPYVLADNPTTGSFIIRVYNANNTTPTGSNSLRIYFRIINNFTS